MTTRRIVRAAVTVAAALAAVALGAMVISSTRARAQEEDGEESKIQIGFEIAPVPLNLSGKNRALVGLGSYIVNARADCNGCHSAGSDTEFATGGVPFFGQPLTVNPATYLGGGRDFGPFKGVTHIYSRNLTPDKTGLPEGGHTFAEFVQIMRNGTDFDHVHPTCTGAPDGICIEPPFDGDVLQIMPWPFLARMNDHDLRAIYEYLSAIPCIENPPPAPSILHNDCN
jgi:hypothetical protein